MRYDEGWACDSDPEDDRMTDSSWPIGSRQRRMNQRKMAASGNEVTEVKMSYSSASSGQWRPRLRHERDISSAAGDTSDASNAVHHLRSIREGDGAAVKASSEWKDQWW